MSNKAELINLARPDTGQAGKMDVRLESGRRLMVHSDKNEERVEITDTEGEIVIRVRLTEDGPTVSIQGTRLELKSTESISLVSRKVHIMAEDEAAIESAGGLGIKSADEMTIHSDDDVSINAKTIHLN